MTATVMLSAFLVVMNNATVNVILPPMMTAFSLNLDQVQWVVTGYMIAGAVMVPTVGWAAFWATAIFSCWGCSSSSGVLFSAVWPGAGTASFSSVSSRV